VSKYRVAPEYDARFQDGANSRYQLPLPQGRGSPSLLVVDDGGARLVLPFAKRRNGSFRSKPSRPPGTWRRRWTRRSCGGIRRAARAISTC
jgi:hypothetical protein